MDIELLEKGYTLIAGSDEVGRGPLAGPVVAATAILFTENEQHIKTKDFYELFETLPVTDSKALTQKKRLKLLDDLGIELADLKPNTFYTIKKSKEMILGFALFEADHKLVDQMNVLAASLYSMKKSFEQCFSKVNKKGLEGILLIDGNKKPDMSVENVKIETVVKGDSKSKMIGLASIIAKEYRDHLMEKMGTLYPGYEFEKHAGYPTVKHKEAIIKLGPSPIHRVTFKGVKEHVESKNG